MDELISIQYQYSSKFHPNQIPHFFLQPYVNILVAKCESCKHTGAFTCSWRNLSLSPVATSCKNTGPAVRTLTSSRKYNCLRSSQMLKTLVMSSLCVMPTAHVLLLSTRKLPMTMMKTKGLWQVLYLRLTVVFSILCKGCWTWNDLWLSAGTKNYMV